MKEPRLLLVLAAVLALPSQVRAVAGVLDPSFGTGGMAVVSLDGEGSFASALQPDGKVVSVGDVNLFPDRRLVVVRYDTDGNLDPSFGSGGISIIASGVDDPQPHDIVVLSDGKLLITAFVRTAPNTYTTALVRLAAEGSLDTGFGTGGVVTQGAASILRVVLQTDGKILAGGNIFGSGPGFDTDIAITRYNHDGTVDTSFGTNGIAQADVTTSFEQTRDLYVMSDGRIVAVGEATVGPGREEFSFARWFADGTLDPTFANGGTLFLPIGSGGIDLALGIAGGPGGRTVAVGIAGASPVRDLAIVSLDGNGSPEAAFAGDGIVTTDFQGGEDWALDATLEPDGRTVVAARLTLTNAGPIPSSTQDDFRPALLRYLPTGGLDPRFGVGGATVLTDANFPDLALYAGDFNNVLRLPDGRLVATGTVGDLVGNTFFLVARFLNNTCGDGIVEPGEDCDDGNTTAGDCCSPSCQFDVAGTACAEDGSHCTLDRCDGAGRCDHRLDIRPTCRVPTHSGAAQLQIKDKSPDKGDQLTWKWRKGAQVGGGELLEPFVPVGYTLCGFDLSSPAGALLFEATAPGGRTCHGGGPCWGIAGSDKVQYRNPEGSPDGVQQILLKPGTVGKAQATVKAKGSRANLPALPLPTSLLIQLQIENGGICFEGRYSAAGIKTNDTGEFKAKSD